MIPIPLLIVIVAVAVVIAALVAFATGKAACTVPSAAG